MKRIQLILPDDLHTKFKVVCTLEGTDMSEIVRGWIEEYVKKEEKRKLIVSQNPKVTRMERARQVREHLTDPNPAFLYRGTHG